MENNNLTLDELNSTLTGYQEKLDALRVDGVFKARDLKAENEKISKNKNITKEAKKEIIETNNVEIKKAARVQRQNKGDIDDLVSEAKTVLKTNYPSIYAEKKAAVAEKKAQQKIAHKTKIEEIKKWYAEEKVNILKKYEQKTLQQDEKVKFNEELKNLETKHNEKVASIKNSHKNDKLDSTFENANRGEYNSLLKEKENVLSEIKNRHTTIINEAKATKDKEKIKVANANYRHEYFDKENYYDEKIYALQIAYDAEIKKLFEPLEKELSLENEQYEAEKSKIYEKYGMRVVTKEDIENKKQDLYNLKMSYKNKLYEEKQLNSKIKENLKNEKHEAYLYQLNNLKKITDNKIDPITAIKAKFENYCYNFKTVDFLLRNGLYIIIIVFFIYAIIGTNGNLLSLLHINNMLTQTSTKLFYSLGVAGLILLAGTDLSIGRMTALGACITLMCIGNQVYEGAFFGGTIDLSAMGANGRIIIALVLSILFCTAFSTIAGFFSAKFKMHPFITTLSTQLVIFGLMLIYFTRYPAFNIDQTIRTTVIGSNQSLLIVYAVIAVIIMWFIWNRTKFGKNLYAVGGNAEAASVSGISVFWTTLAAFIMAGVLYGLGGFFEGIRSGVANTNLGSGTELDAIAACVIGGISFSGGIGKIRGAVIGTIIFTCLTYCLTLLGFDSNMQYIFKGVIIMVAVCLDSLKYLKKK